jgi:ABC-type branched-subunit amino acid transport system substrate-binding protein/LysM repeat protein
MNEISTYTDVKPISLNKERGIKGVRSFNKSFVLLFSLFTFHFSFAQNSSDKTVVEKGKKLYLHIVLKGETVYGLSKDYNVLVRDIVMENPNAMNGISPGDSLRIPYPAATAGADTSQYIYHKVVSKETAYSLCKQYKISIALLDSLNPILKTKGLQAGQTLRIPVFPQPKPATLPVVKQQPVNNPPPTQTVINEPINKPVHDTTKEKKAFQNLVNQEQKRDTVKKVVTTVPVTQPVQQPITQPVTQPTTVPIKPGQLLPRYNVAILLPFSSEGIDTIRINRLLNGTAQLPLLTQISADFYQGVLIAVDSLAKQGLKVNLYVYNMPASTDTSGHRLDSILKIPTLPMMNLIIGPAYPSHFKIVAKFAAQHNIPIVSPLSGENNILLGNAYSSKATPSSVTEMEDMADYIAAHHQNQNVIILHHRYSANDVYFDAFKKRYNADLQLDSKTDSATVADYTDNMSKLGEKIAKDKNNIIVVPYQGESFVTKLVNQLANSKYSDDDSLTVFGMHNWLNIDVLDMANLDTLNFHFASNEYVNYADSCTRRFIKKYRYNYYTEPSYYASQGFDVAYFYLGLLKKFGTGIQDHLGDMKYKGVHTSFDFHQLDPTGGYENKAIYILEYKNYTVIKNSL